MSNRSVNLAYARKACWSGAAVMLLFGATLLGLEDYARAFWGIELGPWGANFVALAVVLGLAGLLVTRHHGVIAPQRRVTLSSGGLMAFGQKAAIVSLAANALIALTLVMNLRTPSPDADGLSADAATVLATATAILAILVADGVVQKIFRRREGADTLEDERDVQIQGEASQVGHTVLIALLLFLVLQLGIGGAMAPWISPNDALGLSSPVAIAHAMLAALFVSQCSRHAATIWMYRRSSA